jgi:hypothetical protein
MEARWLVEFTGVVLAGGAELTAPVEKAAAGRRRNGEGGRSVAALGYGGDASWRSGDAMESAVAKATNVFRSSD